MGAMQLSETNPNITDLSDQNRPGKIAEQFSELYDNEWRDCYMVFMDHLRKSEQETVEILLTILKTVYDISLNRSQEIMSDARKVLLAFAGMSDGESEKALDSLILETLHKMKSYRTKHFNAVPKDIAKEINVKLVETIGEQEVTACSEYIEACVRICWLMCVKDPPMYIFCEKEDVFNKNHFMEYTEKGHKVSYVVWPVLYLYKDGPLMRKGVAQGEGKKIEDSKVAATEDGSPKSNEFVEKKPQMLVGVHTPVNVAPSEEHEHELSNSCGMNSNNSSNNHGDDSTLEVGQNHIVQTSIAVSEKNQEENSGKVVDAVMSIHDNEMELGKYTNDIVLLENETRTVDTVRDMDASHSLDERGQETEERIVSPLNDNDRPEVNVKVENVRVGDVCILSENIVPGENDADDYIHNVAVATDDGVANGDAVVSIHDNEIELGKKTNDIFPLENETRTVDNARDMDASHSLDERGEETEEHIVSPSNDKDRPEVNVKEENLRVGDVCSLSENSVPGENDADDYNRSVAVATADCVANPTVELQKEKHHQGKLSEDSSVEGH